MAVDPGGRFAQQRGVGAQQPIDFAQCQGPMPAGIGVTRRAGAGSAGPCMQGLCDRASSAMPAGGDADAAVPEARPGQIEPGPTDQARGRCLEAH